MNLIILGPQGSGKGTQAELLAKKFNLAHIDMGLVLRVAAFEKSAFGKNLNLIINKKRELVSCDIVKKVLQKELEKIAKNRGVILDGAPRRMNQIGDVENVFKKFGRKIDNVIFINISSSESVKRISMRYNCSKCKKNFILGKDIKKASEGCRICGGKISQRPDDTPAGVKKRLKIFKRETLPVIKEFKKRGLLVGVGGTKNPRQIFRDLIRKL